MPTFLSDVLLDRDPLALLNAATKQYVDSRAQSASGIWRWVAASTSATPAAGKVGVNNDVVGSATTLWIHKMSDDNLDFTNVLASLRSGDSIYAQDKTTATSWIRWSVTAASVVSGNGYSISVSPAAGAQGSEPANNTQLLVQFGFGGGGGGGGGTAEVFVGPGTPPGSEILWLDTDEPTPGGGGGGGGLDQTAADARYVNIDGDVMTGNLTISKPYPELFFDRPDATTEPGFVWSNAGVRRWTMRASGDAATDWQVVRHNDDGSAADIPFIVYRGDGMVAVAHGIYCDAPPFGGSVLTNKTYVDTTTVSLSGDTMTGSLGLGGNAIYGVTEMYVGGPLANTAIVWFQTDNVNRWAIGRNNDATGSFCIARFDDGGAFVDMPFQIDRYSGVTTFAKAATVNDPDGVTIDTPAGVQGLVNFSSGGVVRWGFGKAPNAETGGNVGSTFSIARFSDAGAWIDNPLEINRADGIVAVQKPLWLSDGTPTDNNHAASKWYVDQRTPKVTVASSAPSSPATNDVWIDTT